MLFTLVVFAQSISISWKKLVWQNVDKKIILEKWKGNIRSSWDTVKLNDLLEKSFASGVNKIWSKDRQIATKEVVHAYMSSCLDFITLWVETNSFGVNQLIHKPAMASSKNDQSRRIDYHQNARNSQIHYESQILTFQKLNRVTSVDGSALTDRS